MSRRVLFAVEDGGSVGLGHVRRVEPLIAELSRRGLIVEVLSDRLTAIGQQILRMAGASSTRSGGGEVLHRSDAHCVVIDGYRYGADVLTQEASPLGPPLVLFDDNPNDKSYAVATAIVNGSVCAVESEYLDRGASYAWCGPDFILLRDSVRSSSSNPSARSGLVMSFGGSDPLKVSEEALVAIKRIRGALGKDLPCTLIVGPQNDRWPILAERSKACGIAAVMNPADLPQRFAAARVAWVAAGSTVWELNYLQTPTVATVVAKNQERNATAMEAAGLIYLEETAAAPARLRQLLEEELVTPPRVVDGDGAIRLADRIGELL